MAWRLELDRLNKSFGGIKAVCDLSFAVGEGELLGLIGPNGAGKTTLFNIIGGFYEPDSGIVRLGGAVINGVPPHRLSSLGVARTFQNLRLLRRLTVLDNVLLAFQHQSGENIVGAITGWRCDSERKSNSDRSGQLLELVGLDGKARELAGALSYGQQKALTLACCMAMDADLLLLDEPVAGIEASKVQEILSILSTLSRSGKSIIVIEHNIRAIQQVCNRIVVIDEGKKIAEGAPDSVLHDAKVLQAYLT